jgi:cardiolipin synthase
VGSTNLNIASWFGNCELDAVVEDAGFGEQMEAMYLQDLENATEIVLDSRRHLQRPVRPSKHPRRGRTGGRVTAGAVRLGHAIGAALTDRRVLGPVEARLAAVAGLLLCALATLVAVFPRALAYPAAALGTWGGLSLLWKAARLSQRRKRGEPRPWPPTVLPP